MTQNRRPKPKVPPPSEHVLKILSILHHLEKESEHHKKRSLHTDLLVHSAIRRLDHLRELILAIGESNIGVDPEKVRLVIEKYQEEHAKLKSLIEANVPASS